MTANDQTTSERAIAIVRNLHHQLANQCHARGVSPEDIALAAIYSTFDIAEGAKGPGLSAIEWLRTSLDTIERQLLAEVD